MVQSTRGGQDGTGDAHALGEEDGSSGVDLNAVVEGVGVGLVEPEIVVAGQRVVDTFEGDLVLGIVHIDLVIRGVLAVEVTEVVAELVGGVVDEVRHFVVVNGDDSLVQVGRQMASGDALIADATTGNLVFTALSILPLGTEGGGGLIFAAGPLGLSKPNIFNYSFKEFSSQVFFFVTYSESDLAIISARLAKTELEEVVIFVIILDEFFALEDQKVGELTLEFSTEDKVVIIRCDFAALLHHEATTMGLSVSAVNDGRTITTRLDVG